MNIKERQIVEDRLGWLKTRLKDETLMENRDMPKIHRLQGNIGALEWVLYTLPEEESIVYTDDELAEMEADRRCDYDWQDVAAGEKSRA